MWAIYRALNRLIILVSTPFYFPVHKLDKTTYKSSAAFIYGLDLFDQIISLANTNNIFQLGPIAVINPFHIQIVN